MCIYTHKYIHTNIYKIYKCMYDTFGISPSGKASLRAMGSALTGQSLHDYSHPRSFISVTTGTTLLWWVLLCLKQTFVLTPCLCHPFAPHLCSPCDHPPAPRVTLQPRLHPAEHPFWVPWEHSPWSQTATDTSRRRPSRLCRGTIYVGSRAGLPVSHASERSSLWLLPKKSTCRFFLTFLYHFALSTLIWYFPVSAWSQGSGGEVCLWHSGKHTLSLGDSPSLSS